MKKISAILGLALALGMGGTARAQALQLITEEEAKLPSAVPSLTRGITRGPAVKLVSPDTVAKDAFAFKVEFEPRGGARIDPASVKVTYLKKPAVDLTARLKPAIRPEGIELAATSAPVGEHPIHVAVKDSEGREGTATFTLKVR